MKNVTLNIETLIEVSCFCNFRVLKVVTSHTVGLGSPLDCIRPSNLGNKQSVFAVWRWLLVGTIGSHNTNMGMMLCYS
jgi:hypothetical protein